MRSGVILCGGKSARMGADKGLLELKGRPLYQWVLESISTVVDEIVISVSRKEQVDILDFGDFDAIVSQDQRPGLGPIGGLLSGLKTCQGEYVAVAPVDAPLINPQLYELLFERIEDHEAAVPKVRGYWEPLVAVYKRSAMISAIEKAVTDGNLDIRSTFPHLDVVEVGQGEIEVFDPDILSFTNINTGEDLEEITLIIDAK